MQKQSESCYAREDPLMAGAGELKRHGTPFVKKHTPESRRLCWQVSVRRTGGRARSRKVDAPWEARAPWFAEEAYDIVRVKNGSRCFQQEAG